MPKCEPLVQQIINAKMRTSIWASIFKEMRMFDRRFYAKYHTSKKLPS